jgi:hypothetical protein
MFRRPHPPQVGKTMHDNRWLREVVRRNLRNYQGEYERLLGQCSCRKFLQHPHEGTS